jgi:hypothetical protein
MKTLNGHFDGKVVVLDETADLEPNTKVKVIVPSADENERALVNDFARASQATFQKIWDNPLDADYDHL